jgi:hypothetical protein
VPGESVADEGTLNAPAPFAIAVVGSAAPSTVTVTVAPAAVAPVYALGDTLMIEPSAGVATLTVSAHVCVALVHVAPVGQFASTKQSTHVSLVVSHFDAHWLSCTQTTHVLFDVLQIGVVGELAQSGLVKQPLTTVNELVAVGDVAVIPVPFVTVATAETVCAPGDSDTLDATLKLPLESAIAVVGNVVESTVTVTVEPAVATPT